MYFTTTPPTKAWQQTRKIYFLTVQGDFLLWNDKKSVLPFGTSERFRINRVVFIHTCHIGLLKTCIFFATIRRDFISSLPRFPCQLKSCFCVLRWSLIFCSLCSWQGIENLILLSLYPLVYLLFQIWLNHFPSSLIWIFHPNPWSSYSFWSFYVFCKMISVFLGSHYSIQIICLVSDDYLFSEKIKYIC